MTGLRHGWQRSAAAAAGAAALVGIGISAAPAASAHTPKWTVDCSTVSVELTAYNPNVENTVTITVDNEVVLPETGFDDGFSKKITLPEHEEELEVRLVVTAGDGPQFSEDDTKTAPVCDKPETSPSPSEEPSSSPSPVSDEDAGQPSGEPSSSAPAVEPASSSSPAGGTDLAETGGSAATPYIAGAAGAVLLAGAGIVVATRKRRSSQS